MRDTAQLLEFVEHHAPARVGRDECLRHLRVMLVRPYGFFPARDDVKQHLTLVPTPHRMEDKLSTWAANTSSVSNTTARPTPRSSVSVNVTIVEDRWVI